MSKKLMAGGVMACAVASILLTVAHAQQATRANRSTSAPATQAPSVEEIREHASRLAKYRDLLNDKDQSVREAAFTEMTNSADPALQEMAYEVGFASSEISMRALALRTRLTRWAAFSFEAEGINGDPQYVKMMPSTITWHAVGADQQRGILILADNPIQNPSQAGGDIAASGLEVIVNVRRMTPPCWGRMRLDDAGALTGTLTCMPPRVNGPLLNVKAKARMF